MDETEQRRAVLAEARTWLGTPYHPMGRVKGAGVDCAMLPAEVYAACGLIAPQEVGYYPPDWHLHRGAERYLERVLLVSREVAAPGPGDFCLWRFGRCLAHGAIVIGWPRIIHAAQGLGVVEDDARRPGLAETGRAGKARETRFFSLWGSKA